MASWISAPECPLDLRGPVDRPFDRMGRGFSCIAALQHLTTVARKFPDEIAISDGASKFSYSALLTMVLALAEVIATTVAEGQAVGLLLGMHGGRPSVCSAQSARPGPATCRHRDECTDSSSDLSRSRRFVRLDGAPGRPAD